MIKISVLSTSHSPLDNDQLALLGVYELSGRIHDCRASLTCIQPVERDEEMMFRPFPVAERLNADLKVATDKHGTVPVSITQTMDVCVGEMARLLDGFIMLVLVSYSLETAFHRCRPLL
jgi:hypothetical protein